MNLTWNRSSIRIMHNRIKEWNAQHNTWFYVNVSVQPPQSQWTHPAQNRHAPPPGPPSAHAPPPGPPPNQYNSTSGPISTDQPNQAVGLPSYAAANPTATASAPNNRKSSGNSFGPPSGPPGERAGQGILTNFLV